MGPNKLSNILAMAVVKAISSSVVVHVVLNRKHKSVQMCYGDPSPFGLHQRRHKQQVKLDFLIEFQHKAEHRYVSVSWPPPVPAGDASLRDPLDLRPGPGRRATDSQRTLHLLRRHMPPSDVEPLQCCLPRGCVVAPEGQHSLLYKCPPIVRATVVALICCFGCCGSPSCSRFWISPLRVDPGAAPPAPAISSRAAGTSAASGPRLALCARFLLIPKGASSSTHILEELSGKMECSVWPLGTTRHTNSGSCDGGFLSSGLAATGADRSRCGPGPAALLKCRRGSGARQIVGFGT